MGNVKLIFLLLTIVVELLAEINLHKLRSNWDGSYTLRIDKKAKYYDGDTTHHSSETYKRDASLRRLQIKTKFGVNMQQPNENGII